MKAYLFIETGEVRPTVGEEYIRVGTSCCGQNVNSCTEYPILQRHKIELPDNATYIDVNYGCNEIGFKPVSYYRAIVPRPKNKVKKWRWVNVNDGSITEHSDYQPSYSYRKIPETMIEVTEE